MAEAKLKKQTKTAVSKQAQDAVAEDVKVVETKSNNPRKLKDRHISGANIPNKFIVIELNGKQEIVWQGLELTTDKFSEESLKNIKVLMTVDNDKIELGTPVLENSIELEKIQDYLGEKVTTRVYKAKSRYHRTRGKRQHKSLLKVK